MLNALQGKKTFILVLVALLVVALEKGLGWDVPAVAVGDDWQKLVWEALVAGSLRLGMGNSLRAVSGKA